MRLGKRFLKIFLLILALLALSSVIRTGFVLIKPGSAEDLRSLVTVEGADQDDQGKFFLVTVAQQRASLLALVYGYFHPRIEISRLTEIIPQGMDEREYRLILEQMMRESQLLAKLIALTTAGYEVEIESEGSEIVGFLENSPSAGILREGDVITAVDGRAVKLANEVISAVQDRAVGDAVNLTVLRDEQELELSIITSTNPGSPDLPALGVYIRSLNWEPVLPVDITMEVGEIGGPSAGIMFVLEILNQLLPEDITGGRLIAGTGTIDINRNVGRIGGVFQKVIAAENRGAEYFIVPEGNFEEAKQAARRIELIPVSTLDEALDFLSSLTGSTGEPFPWAA